MKNYFSDVFNSSIYNYFRNPPITVQHNNKEFEEIPFENSFQDFGANEILNLNKEGIYTGNVEFST